ncbi:MAG: hypothetical protein NT029_14880 [Armatimonadetes bacterium]|nr:hypothetical protein [Armatimonadota bacterium]
MRGFVAFIMLGCLGLCVQAQAQSGWSHQTVGLPMEVVEGKPAVVRVAYKAPRPAALNVQLKDVASPVVHAGAVRTVNGSGVAEFRIVIPTGKMPNGMTVSLWWGSDWQNTPIPISVSAPVMVLTPERAAKLAATDAGAPAMRRRLGLTEAEPRVLVLSGGWAGRSAAASVRVAAALRAAGVPCVLAGPDEVAGRLVLSPKFVRLLVIPDARTYPAAAVDTLSRYLRAGGHLMALGAPALDRLVYPFKGSWLDSDEIMSRIRSTPARRRLLRVSEAPWRRTSNDMATETTWRPDPAAGDAISVRIASLTSWDTLLTPLEQAPKPDERYITFRAKGSSTTTALAVEIAEKDGSRWIATLPLTPRWERFALPDTAFALWDPEHRSNRQGPGDRLNLTHAASISVGLALTHTRVPAGSHAYSIADLGSAVGPSLPNLVQPPVLDTVSPMYKVYPVRGARSLSAAKSSALVPAPAPELPARIFSTHPRPATGFAKGRGWRWLPLLEVTGKDGVAGTVATLMVHRDDGFARGRWASFTAADEAWYARPATLRYVAATAKAMLTKPLLLEGGCEFYGAFTGDRPRLGAVVDWGPAHVAGAQARITVAPVGGGRPAVVHTLSVGRKGQEDGAATVWQVPVGDRDRYAVSVELLEAGKTSDRMAHEVTVRRAKPKPSFVTASDGQFLLAGRPWRWHGVNYMPSTGVALEDGPMFEQWLSSASYDAEVVERDLRRIQAIGFNMISAFIYVDVRKSRNLVDLLNRCDAHGLKVNLSLRPGTPLDFAWPGVGEIIRENRLAQDDTIIAYDLAWEPAWGGRESRKRWDREWDAWLRSRFGSLAQAEAAWGHAVPVENGLAAGASDEDLRAGSRRPAMALRYRRFLNDLLDRTHSEARRLIHTVDPNHLLSFRGNIAGDPTAPAESMGYEFEGLAGSMDFMSPEGYGRLGSVERVRPGWFTAAYSRLTAPGKPVIWAEFGYTLWDSAVGRRNTSRDFALEFERRVYPPETRRYTEDFYRAFYNMALGSDANGTVCWWYPGGFRAGENSDFGIIDPDGTWRGITKIIHDAGRRQAALGGRKTPDVWIDVPRDAYPDGVSGMYNATKDAFWRAVDGGRFPGLRWAAPAKP